MTTLRIYDETGKALTAPLTDGDAIASAMNEHGVQFERWAASHALAADAGAEDVMAAYRDSIDVLKKKYRFATVDVVALQPDHPQKDELRQKFLSEHTHDDYEIRFFVDGSGLFYLHLGQQVLLILCTRGDLISVPANTPHWFDMGCNPDFKCIRFFTTENGWEADFTGSAISEAFPDMDTFVAGLSGR